MRDEVLGTLDDPGEVADAQLVGVEQRRGKRQARRIGEPLCSRGRDFSRAGGETPLSEPLGRRKVEAEQIAAVFGHENIVTDVRLFAPDLKINLLSLESPAAGPSEGDDLVRPECPVCELFQC